MTNVKTVASSFIVHKTRFIKTREIYLLYFRHTHRTTGPPAAQSPTGHDSRHARIFIRGAIHVFLTNTAFLSTQAGLRRRRAGELDGAGDLVPARLATLPSDPLVILSCTAFFVDALGAVVAASFVTGASLT